MSDDARLEVVLEAKIDKLQASLSKANQLIAGWAAKTQRHLDETDSKWGKLFGKANPGEALERVFSRSRLGLIEEGGARIGVFGSALEALGPAGLIAAGGLAAAAIGFEETEKALSYADALFKTAKNAHVTSDALQELQFALRASGGDEAQAGAALEAFSAKLGLAQEGLPKAQRAFLALGFTKEQIKAFSDAGVALDAVTAKIQNLKSPAQKDAVIQQLGLEGMKVLIEGGVDKMRELREEAQRAGQVLDSGLVAKGHELNEQAETLHKKIKNDLTSAFVDLGPVLLTLVGFMAKVADGAADVVDAFQRVENKRTAFIQADIATREKRDAGPQGLIFGAFDRQRIAEEKAELARRAANPPKAGLPSGGAALVDQSKHAAGPRDDTAQRTSEVDQAFAQADRKRLEALKALTDDIQTRADFERQALEAEAAAERAGLDKKIAEIGADKGIGNLKKGRLIAELELGKVAVDEATAAKQQLLARDAAYAIEQRQIDLYQGTVEAQIATLEAEAAIATTSADRVAIERRILALRQQLESDLAGTKNDKDLKTGAINKEQHDKNAANLAQNQAAARTQFAAGHRTPIDDYLASIQDLDTEIQTAGVNAARSLSSGLADAIVNAKNLGDVGRSVFRQLIQDILQASIQKNVAGPILAALGLPGFATGTSFAPGGMAIVGEHGPEIVNLPRGAQVGTNATLNALSNLSIPDRQAIAVVQPVSFDLRGAVMTADLLQQMNNIAARNAALSVSAARQLARSDLQRSARRSL